MTEAGGYRERMREHLGVDPGTDPRTQRTRLSIARAVSSLAATSTSAVTVSAVAMAAAVTRPSFYNHFDSVEQAAAYAMSLDFDDFQLLDYSSRRRHVPPKAVGLATLSRILDYLSANRELYRLASTWRNSSGRSGLTELLFDQVVSFRREFGDPDAPFADAENLYISAGMSGYLSAAVEGQFGDDRDAIVAELYALLPHWMTAPSLPEQ